jgi:hypothetical protein
MIFFVTFVFFFFCLYSYCIVFPQNVIAGNCCIHFNWLMPYLCWTATLIFVSADFGEEIEIPGTLVVYIIYCTVFTT